MNERLGTVYLIAAWLCFSLFGFVLNFWLGRELGPELYGLYGLIMSVLTWLEVFVINGVPYAVQKFVAADEDHAYPILKNAVRIQLVVVIVLFLTAYFCAPVISHALNDIRLSYFLKLAFLDILVFGFYHLFLAFQNGLHRFERQAFLIVTYSFSKLLFVFLLVRIMHSLAGALLANVAASLAGMMVCLIYINPKAFATAGAIYQKSKSFFRFSAHSLIYFLWLTILFYVDLWSVKYFLSDTICGYYVAASTLARIPYYVFLGLSATILPVMAKALSEQNRDKMQHALQSATRFFLLLALPMAVLITAFSRQFLTLFYSSAFDEAASLLSVLIWGMTFMAFFSILTTVINASDKPALSMKMTAITVIWDLILNVLFVPRYGAIGGAWATTIAIGMGVIMAIIPVVRQFQVLIDWKNVVRIGTSALLLYLFVRLFQVESILFLAICLAGCLFYVAMLVLLKEVRTRDLLDLIRQKRVFY